MSRRPNNRNSNSDLNDEDIGHTNSTMHGHLDNAPPPLGLSRTFRPRNPNVVPLGVNDGNGYGSDSDGETVSRPQQGGRRKSRKSRKTRKQRQQGGQDKQQGGQDKQQGGRRKSKRAPSQWTKFVTKVYHEMKKKDKNVKLGAAMKEASRRKKRGDM